MLYVATANGLAQLANPGKSDRWREIGLALPGEDVRSVVASPDDPLLVYAASGSGVARSQNGGASWDVINTEPTRALAFDPMGTLYVGTERGVVLATHDGTAWTQSDAFSAPVVQITATDEQTLLSVGADGTVFERRDEEWRPREMHVPHVRGLTASREAPRQLFIVNKTSLVTPLETHRLPAEPTGVIVLMSGNQPTLLVGTTDGLLRSDDQGITLSPVDGPTHTTVLVTLPHFIDQAFAGTAGGSLWFSADRGRTWTELRSGYAAIRSLAFARAL